MKTRRAFLVHPGKFDISEMNVNPGPEQILVKVAACGLCNWELNHWKGYIGSCPQSLGHEWGGTVVEVGEKVKGFVTGDIVTGLPDELSGFSDYIAVSEKNCYKLARSVDPKHALGEPLKCILTVLRGATPEAGDVGVVLGCGPMGLWSIQALSGSFLSALIAIDIDDNKLELAKKFGATHKINSKREDAEEKIRNISGGHMADFVIEGTGIPAILNSAVAYLRVSGRGRLIVMSSHETVCNNFDFRAAISKAIEIKATHPGYSINQSDDFRRAVACLNNETFKMDGVISHVFPLENIQQAFETLENKSGNFIKGIVIP